MWVGLLTTSFAALACGSASDTGWSDGGNPETTYPTDSGNPNSSDATTTDGGAARGGNDGGGPPPSTDASGDGPGTGDDSWGGAYDGGPMVGATTPFMSYEAEDGTAGGGATVVKLQSPPTTQFSSPEVEASGHAYVALTQAGQYVEWANQTGKSITAFNVRYSIPDSQDGKGITATLNVYVNGQKRQSINVDSTQSWLYEGGNNNYNGNDQNPADGNPRVFFDEAHAFLTGAPLAPGDKIRLQMDADNAASYYHIDVIDLEAPPPPIVQPANTLSIESCGATANDPTKDSTAAIQNCINMAQSSGQPVWIPQGTYYLNGITGLNANGITIEGAGMWYSTIYRNVPLPNNYGLAAVFSVTSCTVRNFAVDSNALSRATVDGAGGAMDTTGTNWVADSIWTQHTESGFWASGDGGTVENCRLTAIWADGCNVNNVSLTGTTGNDITAKNNFVRGTGDDAIAINSVNYNGNQMYTPMSNVHIINNTSIAPWGGKGVAVYGGSGHIVQNNYVSDTARYIGLGVGKFGANGSDLLSGTVTGNVVVRGGGNGYMQQQAGLHIGNGGDGQSTGTVANVTVSNNTIRDSLYNAVDFSASNMIAFENNTIENPGLNGIVIGPQFFPAPSGSATISNNMVTGLASGEQAFVNMSGGGYVATLSGNNF